MSEKDKRRKLHQLAVGLLGGNFEKIQTEPQQTTTIGVDETPVNELHLNDTTAEWLDKVLGDDGKAYVETVELESDHGTFTFRAEDGTIIMERENNE